MFKLLLLFTCLYMVMAFEINLGGFQKYCQKYGKNYSLQEQAKKLKTWTRNMLNLAKMQMELKNENRGFEVEANKFTDMDDEERAKYSLPKNFLESPAFQDFNRSAKVYRSRMSRSSGTNYVDYRLSPSMPAVRDQGQCGSCWIFATVNAIEVQWGLLNGGLYEFSEQHLLDCRAKSCEYGGFPSDLLSYARTDGIVARSDYDNYTMAKEECKKEPTRHFVVERVRHQYMYIQELLEVAGPLVFHMGVPSSFFAYKSGIYTPTRRECQDTTSLHAMTIVGRGWEDGISYWIVRNSWGADWGEEGYMRIYQNMNACGMEENVFAPECYGLNLPHDFVH